MASRAVLTLLLLSTLAAHLSAETCYLPNGSAIGGLRVCDPSAPASACCALGDECTTNGFCKAGNDGDNNWLWRGTCTDKTWESDSCPKYCYDSSTSEIAAKVNFKVMACSEDSYCCSYPDGYYPLDRPGFDCCDDPKRNFTAGPADFQAGYPVTTKVFVGFASLSGSRAGTSTPKSSTSSSSTSTESEATTSPTSMLESQSNIGQLSTTLASPQTTISSTSSIPSTSSTSSTTDAAALTEHTNASVITDPTVPASPSADKESGMSTGASAGIGVGAGIAALALVGFGVFTGLRLRKRDSSARDGMSKELAGGPSIEQQERQPVYSHRDSRDVKSSVGIYEAGWQLPSEADSIPRGELEGDSVGFRR